MAVLLCYCVVHDYTYCQWTSSCFQFGNITTKAARNVLLHSPSLWGKLQVLSSKELLDHEVKTCLALVGFFLVFICAYNVWVISPPFSHPPSLSPAPSILPLSLILLKREYIASVDFYMHFSQVFAPIRTPITWVWEFQLAVQHLWQDFTLSNKDFQQTFSLYILLDLLILNHVSE
jgi:hypothetical protein